MNRNSLSISLTGLHRRRKQKDTNNDKDQGVESHHTDTCRKLIKAAAACVGEDEKDSQDIHASQEAEQLGLEVVQPARVLRGE